MQIKDFLIVIKAFTALSYSFDILIFNRYPIYQKGNPQLRVYLPNFFMKLVRPDYKQPPNIVKFIVSNEMTNHDIRNYLEKIYNVSMADIRSSIATGRHVFSMAKQEPCQ